MAYRFDPDSGHQCCLNFDGEALPCKQAEGGSSPSSSTTYIGVIMNESLQTALASLINTSMNAWDTATSFLVAEIPQVLYQLLLWHAVYSFIQFCFSIILIVGYCSVVWYFYVKWLNKSVTVPRYYGSEEYITRQRKHIYNGIPHEVIWGACGICVLAASCHLNNLTWLQIWIVS